jgi:hypothetical protein
MAGAVSAVVLAAVVSGCGASGDISQAPSVVRGVRLYLGAEITSQARPPKLFAAQPALAAAMRAEAKLQPRVTGTECYGTYVIAGSKMNCGSAVALAGEFLEATTPPTASATLYATDPETYQRLMFRCQGLSRFGPYECSDSRGDALYLLSYRAPLAPPAARPANPVTVYKLA